MNKFYTVEREIDGVKYIAQFSGLTTSYRLEDETYIDGTTIRSVEKSAAFLFEHGIVEPKGLTPNFFGSDKIGETVTRTIEGKEYVAKFSGLLTALQAVDNSYDDETGITSMRKFTEFVLKNVIVSPANLTIEDFANRKELDAVLKFGREVMQRKEAMEQMNRVTEFAREVINGNIFPDREDKGTTKAKGSK